MNHIYKSIFNKALGVFTAVPEFASAHGKGSERTVVGRVAKGTAGFAASALAISIGLALSSNAMANVDTDVASGVLRIADPTGTNSIRMGSGTTLDDANKQWNSISVGVDAGVNTASSVAIGYGAKAGKTDKFLGQGAVALGYNAQALGTSNISIGEASSATNGHNGVAIGAYSKTENEKTISIGAFSTASGAQSTVISSNYDTNSTGPVSVASGRRSQIYGAETTVSGEQSVSIGDTNTIASARTYALGNNINVAAGTDDSLVFGTKAGVGGANAIALGNTAKATQDNSIAQGTESATYGKQSVSIGYKAVSGLTAPTASQTNAFSVSIGNETEALDASTVAIGDKAKAKGGVDALAVGTQANAMTYKALAIGAYSQATGRQSTVIGNDIQGQPSIASGTRSQIIGVQSNVSGDNSVSIGDTNTIASARTYAMGNNINVKAGINDALAFGTRASVQVAKSIAMGENATAGIDDGITAPYVKPSVAIGAEAKATGKGSVSIGHESASLGESATALGIQATAPGKGQTSLGLHAGHSETGDQVNQQYGVFIGRYAGGDNQNPKVATEGGNIYGIAIGESAGRYGQGGNRNTAIGEQAGQYVKGSHNIALGTQAGKGTDTDKLEVSGTTAIGNTAKALTNDSVAIGTGAKSGKVDRFSGERSVAIGTKAEALGTGGIAIGDNAATTDGHNSVAIGVYSKTQNEKAISIGAFNKATGVQSIVIAGNYDTKNTDGVSTATATRAIAMGAETNVSGEKSVAIGDTNTIASARTYALGNNINVAAGADDSLVFGTRAAVGAANTVAIGANANAAQANSVALGAGSATSAPHTGAYTLNNSYTAAGLPVAANGTVSVGAAGKERQIQNVAAGVISATSTDAINGSQLYATNNYMNNFAGDVKTKLGGNAALGNDGHLTMTNIGGTGENTVDDAIKNLKTAIDNKADTTASVTSENQADIKVDKEAPVGNTTNYKLSLGNDAKAKLAKAATALQTVEGDSNITATKDATDPTKVKLALNKNLTADSLTLGDKAGDHAVVNKDGLTIANGPSVKKDGINAGNKKITGVANGNVAAGSTDAVNGGQLHDTNTKLDGVKAKADSAVQNVVSANPTALTATKAGDTVTLTPNVIAGDLVNPATGAVNTPAAGDAGKLVTAGTVANALANTHFVVDTAKTDGELDAASKHDQKIKSGNKVTLQAGKNLKAKQTNAADGATVEFSLKDSISLTQVTAGTGDNQVVLGNNGVQVGGNTYINKDGLNANNKPISNVADGVKPKDAVNKGQLDAVAQEAAKHTTVKAGQNVEVTEANNAAGGKEYTVKTADNLNVTSVKAGDSTLNTDGLTIAGGPSVKKDGINAGDKKITNVAPGTVAAGSKDAVNGGQLAEVKAKADSAVQNVVSANPTALTANKVGDTVTLTPNFIAGDLVNADGTVKDPAAADEGKLVSAKTVADALKANHFVVDTKANGGKVETGSEADAKVGSGNKVTFEAGKNLVAQQTNTANGGATVNYKLSDTLENLVSVKSAEIEAGIGPNKVVLNNNGVKVGDSTLNDKGLTINNGPSVTDAGINAGDKKITNVAPGAVTPTSKDAVNGSQLYNVADNVKDLIGPDATIDPATGKVTVADPTQGIAGTGKGTIGEAIKSVKDKADTAVQDIKSGDEKALSVTKAGNTYTITPNLSGDLVDANGNITAPTTPADKGKLVTAGTVAEALANTHFVVDTKATDGELDAASQADQKIKASNKVTLQAGKNLKAKQTNGANGAEVEFSLKDSISLKEVKVGEGSANEVVLNNNGVNVAGSTYINKDGLNANGNKVANVKAGDVSATSTDAVNGAQLHNVATSVANVLGGNAAVDGNGNVTSSDIGGTGANTVDDAIKAVNATAAKHTTVVEGKNVKVTKGKNAAGGDEYTVATKDDLDVTSVTAGNTTVNTNGLTITGGPSVTRGGIDAGNRVISGVKAGDVSATSQEAVNGSQLHATNTKLDGVKAKADTAVQDVKSGDENALTAVKDPNTNIVTVTPKLSGDLVDANGNITAPTTPEEKGKLVTAGTVADALANTHFVVDTKATDGELDAASQADQKIKAGNKVTLQAGKNLKAKQTNGANGAQVEFSLKDSISLKEVTAGEGANQVVLGNDGVKVGGNTYINNAGLNANGNKITNVADGVDPNDAVNKGQLDAVGKEAAKHTTVKAGKNVEVTEGTNAAGGKEYTVKTADNLDVTSVKAGDSTLNTDGLTIAGGPSVKKDGINAGDKKITNVAPGAVTPTSKDAVNGSQLYNVADNVKDLIGPDATIDPATGKVTVADPTQGIAGTGKGTIGEAIKSVKDKADTAVQDIKSGDEKALSVTKAGNTYTITPNLSGDLVDANGNITAPTTPEEKGKLVTAGTVAQALANTHFVVDTKATDGELDGASEADQKIKAGNKVTLQAGKNLKAKQTNGANGAQVEFSLKDSISLKEVTAGEGDNQVVLGNDGVKVGGNTYINKDGLNANNKVISNVADGVNPNDAVNKGQLDAVGKEAAKHTTVKAGKNVEVTEGTNAAGGKEYTVKTADNLDVTSVKAGDSTLNTDGLTIAGGPSVKKDGINAGDKKITNVAPGAVTPTSKDAVNGSQLYNVANNVKDLIGPDATIDPATGKVTVADPIKGIGGTGKGNIGDAIQSVKDAADKAAAEHTTVKAGKNIEVEEGTNAAGGKEYTVKTADNLDVTSVKAGDTTVNNDGVTIAGGPSVTKGGINAGGNTITNVADGVNDTDAVNKGQLNKVDTKVSNVAQNVVNVLGGDATVNGNGDITMSNIGETGKGNINDAIKSVNDLAKKAAAEKTSVKAKEGRSNVTVTEGVNAAGGHEYTVDVERSVTNAGSDYVTVTNNHDADTNTTTYTVDVSAKTKASLAKADSAVQGLTSKDGNLNFTKGANGNVEVSFNDNLNVKNVTTDRVQVANGPSMSKDGINAAGKAISNVANGNVAKDSKDAVNGGQLHETAQSVADVIGGGATVKDGKVVAGQNGIGNTGQNTVHGAIAAINQNTANNFNQIRGDLRKMDRDLRGGIAGALATAGLPQAFRPGKSMVAAAASTYRGQSGLAIGVSRISDNGKVILKVTGNTNSRGDFGGTIGAGYQW